MVGLITDRIIGTDAVLIIGTGENQYYKSLRRAFQPENSVYMSLQMDERDNPFRVIDGYRTGEVRKVINVSSRTVKIIPE